MSKYLRRVPASSFGDWGKFCNEIESVVKKVGVIPHENKSQERDLYCSEEHFSTISEDRAHADTSYKLNFNVGLTKGLSVYLEELFPGSLIAATGNFYYPPGGYMGWHTNSNFPYKRIYISWSDGKSYFGYRDPETKEFVKDWDNAGVTVREFDCSDDPKDMLWHTVWSDANRYSFGFRIVK
jgi:hypothetical protein